MNTTFPSLFICLNLTADCFGHGECTSTSDGFSCVCASHYDPSVNCLLNFWQYYNLRDAYYYVIGLIGCILGCVILTPELILDVSLRKHKLPNFRAKVLTFAYFIFRAISFMLWCWFSVVKNPMAQVAYSIISNLAIICGVATYMVIITMWIRLYTRTIQLSTVDTAYFHHAKYGLSVAIVIYIPGALALNILSSIGINPNLTQILYNAFCGFYLLVLIVWSSYHSISIHLHFENDSTAPETVLFLQKNLRLTFASLFLLSYVITLVFFVAMDLRSNPWGYLITQSFLRLEELVALYIGMNIMQTYSIISFHPYDNWKRAWSISKSKSKSKSSSSINAISVTNATV